MSRMDIVSSGLNTLNMYSKQARSTCTIKPASKLLINVLKKFKEMGYLKEFEMINDTRGGILKIDLAGKINECKAIRPRYSVKVSDLEKYEKRFLPARNFGYLIISTPKGFLTHVEAKNKKVGGKLIAFVY